LQRDGAHAPLLNRVFLLVPAQAFVGDFLQTFKDFQVRQKPSAFNLETG